MTLQADVDYTNDAQIRVAADTLCLQKKTTLSISQGETSVSLADEVIQIFAVYRGTSRLEELPLDEMILAQTGDSVNISDRASYAALGRSFYITPAPTQDVSLNVIYAYRPAAYNSENDLEVSGQAEILVERLVGAMRLQDDGQPERAAAELYAYEQDAAQLRNQILGRGDGPRRMLVVGTDWLT